MTPIPIFDDCLIPLSDADPALPPSLFVNDRDAINRLTRLTLQPWLAAELERPVKVWPAKPEEISALVDGVAFCVGDWRIVVVAQDTVGSDELLVPQEWVDSPSWRADYYVGVKLEQREGRFRGGHFRIVGCTTHQLLKAEGHYDAFERLYSIEPEQLLSWDVFCSCYQNYGSAQTQAEVAVLAELEAAQAQQLIARLGDPQELLPRLEVPFALWGALLANEHWRSQLYQTRYGQAATSNTDLQNIFQPLTCLSDWLRGRAALPSTGRRGLGEAIAVRSAAHDTDRNIWQPPEALLSSEQLNTLQLNPEPSANPSADGASSDAEQGSVLYRAKTLGPELEEATLIVGLSSPELDGPASASETSEEVEVQIQLRLVMGERQSPLESDSDASSALLRIKLLAEDGSEIAQASAERDEALQIELSGSLGESFTVEIAGGQQSVTERFVI